MYDFLVMGCTTGSVGHRAIDGAMLMKVLKEPVEKPLGLVT